MSPEEGVNGRRASGLAGYAALDHNQVTSGPNGGRADIQTIRTRRPQPIPRKANKGSKHMRKLMTTAAFALLMSGTAAMAQETIKIGYIDPLSGGGASVGEVGLKTFQFLADEVNAKGGIQGKKVEIVPFDNKTNPQESLVQAQKAIDAGIRYLTQGLGQNCQQIEADREKEPLFFDIGP